MIKKELISKVRGPLTVRQAKWLINDFMEAIMDEVSEGHPVNLRGFGLFKTITLKQKAANLPTTKDKVIPEHKAIRFIPGLLFKKRLKVSKLQSDIQRGIIE